MVDLGRRNWIDAMRLFASLVVVWSHAIQRTGIPLDPLGVATGFNGGWWAVNLFFAVSGYLIPMSRERSRSLWHFLWKRALRIYPAFLLCLPICAIYFSAKIGWIEVLNVLTLGGIGSVNPPVWTIRFEDACYTTVAILFGLGLFSKRYSLWLFIGSFALSCWLYADPPAMPPDAYLWQGIRLYTYFLAGSVLYHYRDRVRYSWPSLGIAAAVLVGLSAIGLAPFVAPLAIPYLALGVGLKPTPFKLPGDLSYGTYLWHWPVQTVLIGFGLSTFPLLGASLALTLCLAAVSWFLVERPALSLKEMTLRQKVSPTPQSDLAIESHP